MFIIIEAKSNLILSDEEEYTMSLGDILAFVTGASSSPPMGFSPRPSISFHSESPYPLANSCCNILKLPLFGHTYDSFVSSFCFGIANAIGYGQV